MVDWGAIFDPNVPVLEIFVRGTLVYLGLLALLRLVGQREAGAIGLHDLLVLLLVAEAIQNGLAGDYRAVPDGLMLVIVIVAWSVAIDAIAWRWPRLDGMLKPSPKPLVEDGRLNMRVLRRELMAPDELMSQLRLHGVENLSEVKRAFIEPNGMISVIRRDHGEVDAPQAHGVL